MGPSGVRALLLEMHTRRFNVLQLQYLETIFEVVRAWQVENASEGDVKASLQSHMAMKAVPSFGDFGDREGYNGHVPSEHYLSYMLKNQHTACLAVDQLAIDDSHKVPI
jgi:hypothetical protein